MTSPKPVPTPKPLARTRAVHRRPCSVALVLEVFLLVVGGMFVVRWWHWRTSPAAISNFDAQRANLRGFDAFHPVAKPKLQVALDARDRLAEERANSANANTNTRQVPAKVRVFVPPGSDASASAQRAWRARFNRSTWTEDQHQVAKMVAWAWNAYEKGAFGQDYLDVWTMKGDGLPGHDMALTLVDSLDTLFIVGMFDEFDRASAWVAKNMKARIWKSGYISLFETTIRSLGGLLSAYYLSGQAALLQAADELGKALLPAFDQHSHGLPDKDFDVMYKQGRGETTIAEVGSLQLEFKYLARATGNDAYRDRVDRIMGRLFDQVKTEYKDGLLPYQLSTYNGRITYSRITLGASGDSYYEYLLKQWLLSGKQEDIYRREYLRAVEGIRNRLVAKSKPNGLVFIGEIDGGELSPKMDHLVCFVPGMLTLGYIHGMPETHLSLAKQLVETCYQMYDQMYAKLAPEIVHFRVDDDATEDIEVYPRDAFNLQRPETVESLMLLYRVTKDEKYREYGRKIMAAFEKHSRLPEGGYTTLSNIAVGPIRAKYSTGMESFFVAETLKYLFLLFSDDPTLLPLDEIVFNTEAHPFPMATAPLSQERRRQ